MSKMAKAAAVCALMAMALCAAASALERAADFSVIDEATLRRYAERIAGR